MSTLYVREERGEYSTLGVQAVPGSQAVYSHYSQFPAESQLTSHRQQGSRAALDQQYCGCRDNGITDHQQFEPGQAQARDDEVL